MLTKVIIVLALLVILIGMFRNRKSDRPSRTTNVLLVLIAVMLFSSLFSHFFRHP